MLIESLIQQLERYATNNNRRGQSQLRESQGAAQQVADELIALQSIYGPECLTLMSLGSLPTSKEDQWSSDQSIRLIITFPLQRKNDAEECDTILIKLSVTLAPGYPQSQIPPQMQLLNKYIGSHGVDHAIFGEIMRLYYHQQEDRGVAFTLGEVAVFEGIERAQEAITTWYQEREADAKQRRGDVLDHRSIGKEDDGLHMEGSSASACNFDNQISNFEISITSSAPIIDRKSVFVGHAAILNDVSEVPSILSKILEDRKIAKATHPAIHAWICKSKENQILHRDCDDDGETAAGGRLAHLLDLLVSQ